MSGRTIARKYQVSRRTVRAALTSVWPQPRKPMPPRASKLDPFKPVIDDMLRVDLDAPRKQGHTVKRIYDRLIDEHGMRDVSYPVVRAYVADRKPQIRAEASRGPVDVALRLIRERLTEVDEFASSLFFAALGRGAHRPPDSAAVVSASRDARHRARGAAATVGRSPHWSGRRRRRKRTGLLVR